MLLTLYVPDLNPIGAASCFAFLVSVAIGYLVPWISQVLNERLLELTTPYILTALFIAASAVMLPRRIFHCQHYTALVIYLAFAYTAAIGLMVRSERIHRIAGLFGFFISSGFVTWIAYLVAYPREHSVYSNLPAFVITIVAIWVAIPGLAALTRKRDH